MHKQSSKHNFLDFLFQHWKVITILITLALAWRLFVVIRFPHPAPDETRYTTPAKNMLSGAGFSSDTSEPILPSEQTVPGYPLFIAALYAVFGEHNVAVRIAQALVDTASCLLVAFLAFHLAPISIRDYASLAGFIIYAYLSWFTLFWTRYILTETLAIFLTLAVVTLSLWALGGKTSRWFLVGIVCAAAMLTRPDSLLLAIAMGLFLALNILGLL